MNTNSQKSREDVEEGSLAGSGGTHDSAEVSGPEPSTYSIEYNLLVIHCNNQRNSAIDYSRIHSENVEEVSLAVFRGTPDSVDIYIVKPAQTNSVSLGKYVERAPFGLNNTHTASNPNMSVCINHIIFLREFNLILHLFTQIQVDC